MSPLLPLFCHCLHPCIPLFSPSPSPTPPPTPPPPIPPPPMPSPSPTPHHPDLLFLQPLPLSHLIIFFSSSFSSFSVSSLFYSSVSYSSYSSSSLHQAATLARSKDSDTLLEQTDNTTTRDEEEKVFFITTYHPHAQLITNLTRNNWEILGRKQTTDNLHKCKLICGFRRPKNLRYHLY